jgi:hypothetical protein
MAMAAQRSAPILTWDFRHFRSVVLRRGHHWTSSSENPNSPTRERRTLPRLFSGSRPHRSGRDMHYQMCSIGGDDYRGFGCGRSRSRTGPAPRSRSVMSRGSGFGGGGGGTGFAVAGGSFFSVTSCS